MAKLNPNQYANGVYIPGRNGTRDRGQTIRRNEAMLVASENGAGDASIAEACKAGGWNVSAKSVGPRLADARKARAKGAHLKTDRFDADKLSADIMAAIMPIVIDHVERLVAPYREIAERHEKVQAILAEE